MTDPERVRLLAADRQRRRRARLRFEKAVRERMERYDISREKALLQLRPRVGGSARGWEPTRRPRGVRRIPGRTVEAARRREYLRRRARAERLREHQEDLEERRLEQLEERGDHDLGFLY